MHATVLVCPGHNLYICAWISNNLALLFSLRSRNAINTCSGKLKVKVKIEGQVMKWSYM